MIVLCGDCVMEVLGAGADGVADWVACGDAAGAGLGVAPGCCSGGGATGYKYVHRISTAEESIKASRSRRCCI
jgi:hypothetical protein